MAKKSKKNKNAEQHLEGEEERSIIRIGASSESHGNQNESELEVLVSEEAAAEEVPSEEILEALEPEALEAQAPGEESIEVVTDADLAAHHSEEPDEPTLVEVPPEVEADLAPVEEVQKITDRVQIEQVLEAIIFAAPKAISLVRLRNLLNSFHYDTSNLSEILDDMIYRYQSQGFQLIKVGGGYHFRTHPEHAPVLQKLLEDKPARLSGSALEVLAIIAYKQPLSRSEIDSVRGVDSGHLLKGLLEKNLVRTVGHSENAGRALLYGTTPYFLEVFSLGSLDDLPAIEEFQRELKPNSGDGTNDTLVLAAEPGAMPDSSGLAANPDRGQFDEISDEPVESADFGVEERALEEDNERGPEATP